MSEELGSMADSEQNIINLTSLLSVYLNTYLQTELPNDKTSVKLPMVPQCLCLPDQPFSRFERNIFINQLSSRYTRYISMTSKYRINA